MEYLKPYEIYNEDLLVERLDLKPLFYKLKSSINKKSVSNLIIGSLLTVLTIGQTIQFIQNRKDLSENDKIALVDTVSKYKDPQELKLSRDGWEHVKSTEKLKLKGYKIGDGMVTIGYGHAKPIKKSKFRVGQRITEEVAKKLLVEDVNVAAEGVKRMFRQWKENGEADIKITQNQYDVLVSMAFNMGVGGLRNSKFIKTLKKNDLEKAAELIKTTGLTVGFAGLIERRMKEYLKFIA